MAENKTQPTSASVADFIAAIEHPTRREDSQSLLQLMTRLTGMKPCMWGESIVGYGLYHYRYESGREGSYFLTGFAPRKAASTVYIMPGFKPYADQLSRLGPHRHSSSCLYITRLSRIDLTVLEEIVADSVQRMQRKYDWQS